MKIDLQKIFIFVLILVGGFWCGYFFNQKINIEAQQGANFNLLFKTWNQIENKFYKFSEEKSEQLKQEMLYGAIEGMIQSLNDPYSDFLMLHRLRHQMLFFPLSLLNLPSLNPPFSTPINLSVSFV